jgi:hypothetical protein
MLANMRCSFVGVRAALDATPRLPSVKRPPSTNEPPITALSRPDFSHDVGAGLPGPPHGGIAGRPPAADHGRRRKDVDRCARHGTVDAPGLQPIEPRSYANPRSELRHRSLE